MSQQVSCRTKRKPVKPNLFETRDLIKLVKERKCLWDRMDHDYRDKGLKDAAWLEVYKSIEPDYDHFGEDMKYLIGSQITKKWYNVRDSFVKSKKNGRNKPYIYSKMLEFLAPVYFGDKDKTEENEEDNSEQWLNEQVFVIDEESENKRQKIENERNENQDNILAMLQSLINREEDEDRAFFTSITPAVKKLSTDSKMEFRINVMNILKELQSKEKNAIVEKSNFRLKIENDTDSE